MAQQQEKLAQQEEFDRNFIANETQVVDDLCRRIVQIIDRGNIVKPQYVCECEELRLMQDEAIGLCSNLKRELNHIANVIPSNKNFLALVTEDIEKEIALLRGWRKLGNTLRTKAIEREIEQRKTVAEKMGFVVTADAMNQQEFTGTEN